MNPYCFISTSLYLDGDDTDTNLTGFCAAPSKPLPPVEAIEGEDGICLSPIRGYEEAKSPPPPAEREAVSEDEYSEDFCVPIEDSICSKKMREYEAKQELLAQMDKERKNQEKLLSRLRKNYFNIGYFAMQRLAYKMLIGCAQERIILPFLNIWRKTQYQQ